MAEPSTTIMTLDPVLELSLEQLVRALNKKLLMECTRVQSAMPPPSRALVVTLTVEVRPNERDTYPRILTRCVQVDALEKRAKDILHEVITLRNALRPVNRLPPEVIALCATFVSPIDLRSIISLTHVCRYWRKAITSSPRNWASISTGWRRLTPLCLERAGVVPLTVNITVSDIPGNGMFLQALLPHISKISHLSLTGYPSIERAVDDLPNFFASPIPNLTSLELEQTGEPAQSFPSNETPAPPLFQEVSKLKSLYLTRTPLYPSLIDVRSLVELKLVGYTTPFPFGKFIRFLRLNPTLELVVLDTQFTEVPGWVTPAMTVSLARLRQLTFTCAHASDAKTLISSISFPRGVSLEVISSRTQTDAELRSYLPSPPTLIQRLLAPIAIVKCQNEPGVVQLYGNDSSLSFRCSGFLYDAYYHFSMFSTAAVREFHMKSASCRDLSWPLSRLLALETLVLVGVTSFPRCSLDFLAKEPMPCPSLKTIAFFDCDLDPSIIGELEEVVSRRKDSTVAWLHRVVIVRRVGRLPDCDLIHRLRQFVPRVDVRIDEELPDLP